MSTKNTTIRHQSYRFRLEPKAKHLDHLNRSLGVNRWVWNKLLAANLHRLRNGMSLLVRGNGLVDSILEANRRLRLSA
ncbi:MAG: helix-turn-helix domain-containing protein [Methylicorpusculum sp.]|uniref:helix-turn-helix domain-containing protein n=1 Tax=Methylicorpusculum TaxID=2713642 RepID=UPI0013587642|nr:MULTISPECIES: helix-turn-helix domain-containing protein [Methylicorpusculum]MCD2452044.1 helix-turn-helix domain-containing protein [Methylicorpusculum oleiharenae]MDP2203491.1 helix-turn-helix domain-containing protein [Methylicorpusculum sp.]